MRGLIVLCLFKKVCVEANRPVTVWFQDPVGVVLLKQISRLIDFLNTDPSEQLFYIAYFAALTGECESLASAAFLQNLVFC